MTFQCKLVCDGMVQEFFYRNGESAEDVLDVLMLFEWPRGKWEITPVDEDEE